MANNYDFARDANPQSLYLAAMHTNFPKYAKEYTIPNKEEIEKISAFGFADPVNRLHPIHCKEAAFISGVYLHGQGKDHTPEMIMVKRAASIFGVADDLENVISEMDAFEAKSAAAKVVPMDDEYAMTVNVDGATENFYPLNNEVQTQKSAQEFYNDFMENKFPADWAHVVAKNIVKKAKEQDLPFESLPERVVTLGTERLVNFDTAEKLAAMRKYDGADENAVKIYEDIAKAASSDRDNLDEYLKLWADMDMSQGISYADTFTPQEAFFTGVSIDDLEKMASNVVLIDGVMVPVEDFTKLSEENIRHNFRDEIADVIDSSVKLASTDAPMASKYVDLLDVDNKQLLLQLLID